MAATAGYANEISRNMEVLASPAYKRTGETYDAPGGVVEITKSGSVYVSKDVIMTDKISFVSSAI
jgi:hypothetical protein